MQWHKTVVPIIILTLSVINFALTAPVLVREMKRWNPPDESSTNAEGGMANAPPSPDSDGRTGLGLMPLRPQHLGPINFNPSHSSQGSTGLHDHPPPAGNGWLMTLEQFLERYHPHNPGANLEDTATSSLNIDLNYPRLPSSKSSDKANQDNSHPLSLRIGPPPPAHDRSPLGINLNHPYLPSPGPSDQDNSHPLSLALGPPPSTNVKLPLDINTDPHPQGAIDDSSSWSHRADFKLWSHLVANMNPSRLPSPQPNLPDRLGHDNLGEGPLSNPGPGPTGGHPTPEALPLHPGSLKRPMKDPSSDQGSPKRLDSDAPLDVAPLRWAYPPAELPTLERPSDPVPSTWAYPQSNPESSTWLYPLQDPGPSTWTHAPPDPGPSTWAHASSWPFQGSSTWLYPPLGPQPSTLAHPPPDPELTTWLYPLSGPGPSTPQPPSRPPAEPQPEHKTEIIFSDLFRGRFKRRLSHSRAANTEGVAGYS